MIKLEGSKSIANRALIINHICKIQNGHGLKLNNLGSCDDIETMKKGLRELHKSSKPQSKNASQHSTKINLGMTGTAVRFLTALAATTSKEVVITGDKRMRERPMQPLTDALKKLGANLETSHTGCPPINIYPSSKQLGGSIEIPGNISSQYITALLLVSPLMPKGLTIRVKDKLVSRPYIEMTIALMKKCGVKVETNTTFRKITVKPGQKYKPVELDIEGDASSASYLGAYTILRSIKEEKPHTIKIANLSKNSIQGDVRFIEYLKKTGCKVKFSTSKMGTKNNKLHTLEITGTPSPTSLGEIDMGDTPDLVMTFAILAAITPGTTTITNIENLKIKESNRLLALKIELKKLGVKVTTGKDYIKITGRNPKDFPLPKKRTTIKTYNDHRLAMAFGTLKKTIMPKLVIKEPHVVKKSYPKFWSDLNGLNRKN